MIWHANGLANWVKRFHVTFCFVLHEDKAIVATARGLCKAMNALELVLSSCGIVELEVEDEDKEPVSKHNISWEQGFQQTGVICKTCAYLRTKYAIHRLENIGVVALQVTRLSGYKKQQVRKVLDQVVEGQTKVDDACKEFLGMRRQPHQYKAFLTTLDKEVSRVEGYFAEIMGFRPPQLYGLGANNSF